MGCDIHLFTERRNEAGEWESADTWTPDPYAEEGEPKRQRVFVRDALFSERNYGLFAVLANVRNGIGFAGVDTGEGYRPISEPKGLPADVSAAVQAESDEWDCNGHSHSWHTVADLLAYDWTQVTTLRGWVEAPAYMDWVRYGRQRHESPKEWCGAVDGRGVVHLTDEEMRERTRDILYLRDAEREGALAAAGLANAYAKCEWQQRYYMVCERFLARTLPRLLRLGKPEDARIVFWFDN